jgi:two-component system sensor histidine kinase/response regulator
MFVQGESRMNKPIRVLVADDDRLVSKMLVSTLQGMEGYVPVAVATDGLQAVQMAAEQEIDVVLMDIRMPTLDGIEAARRIHVESPTPVVLLSAYETRELVEKASEVGVGAYLVKPINSRDLERAIAIAMARFDDIMELKRLNHELEARNEDLDAFAHTVAHDLQNPLALMIGFAEAVRRYRQTMSVEDLERSLSNIEESGRRMSEIIEQLLLLAQARKLDIEPKPLEMGSIVRRARKRLLPLLRERKAQLILPEKWPTALGHSQWVEEVWFNYLANAIKHSARSTPCISVGGAWADPGMVRFWVADDGPGIAQSERDKLFGRAQGRDLKPSNKGYGLGLSIVQRIVARLGGEAALESAEGEGSIFSFTLPAARGTREIQEEGAES